MIDVVHPPAISSPIDPIDYWHVQNLDLVHNFGKPGYEQPNGKEALNEAA